MIRFNAYGAGLITSDASGNLTSSTIGTSLVLSAGTLNAIQDIRTTATPTFERINLVQATNPYLSFTSSALTSYFQLTGANLDVYVGGNNAFTVTTNGVERGRFNDSGLTTNGGLQTFGAADSGGVGFRMVRVPN